MNGGDSDSPLSSPSPQKQAKVSRMNKKPVRPKSNNQFTYSTSRKRVRTEQSKGGNDNQKDQGQEERLEQRSRRTIGDGGNGNELLDNLQRNDSKLTSKRDGKEREKRIESRRDGGKDQSQNQNQKTTSTSTTSRQDKGKQKELIVQPVSTGRFYSKSKDSTSLVNKTLELRGKFKARGYQVFQDEPSIPSDSSEDSITPSPKLKSKRKLPIDSSPSETVLPPAFKGRPRKEQKEKAFNLLESKETSSTPPKNLQSPKTSKVDNNDKTNKTNNEKSRTQTTILRTASDLQIPQQQQQQQHHQHQLSLPPNELPSTSKASTSNLNTPPTRGKNSNSSGENKKKYVNPNFPKKRDSRATTRSESARRALTASGSDLPPSSNPVSNSKEDEATSKAPDRKKQKREDGPIGIKSKKSNQISREEENNPKSKVEKTFPLVPISDSPIQVESKKGRELEFIKNSKEKSNSKSHVTSKSTSTTRNQVPKAQAQAQVRVQSTRKSSPPEEGIQSESIVLDSMPGKMEEEEERSQSSDRIQSEGEDEIQEEVKDQFEQEKEQEKEESQSQSQSQSPEVQSQSLYTDSLDRGGLLRSKKISPPLLRSHSRREDELTRIQEQVHGNENQIGKRKREGQRNLEDTKFKTGRTRTEKGKGGDEVAQGTEPEVRSRFRKTSNVKKVDNNPFLQKPTKSEIRKETSVIDDFDAEEEKILESENENQGQENQEDSISITLDQDQDQNQEEENQDSESLSSSLSPSKPQKNLDLNPKNTNPKSSLNLNPIQNKIPKALISSSSSPTSTSQKEFNSKNSTTSSPSKTSYSPSSRIISSPTLQKSIQESKKKLIHQKDEEFQKPFILSRNYVSNEIPYRDSTTASELRFRPIPIHSEFTSSSFSSIFNQKELKLDYNKINEKILWVRKGFPRTIHACKIDSKTFEFGRKPPLAEEVLKEIKKLDEEKSSSGVLNSSSSLGFCRRGKMKLKKWKEVGDDEDEDEGSGNELNGEN